MLEPIESCRKLANFDNFPAARLTLILDTSTERGVVVLAKGEQVIAERQLPVGNANCRYLFPSIRDVLLQGGVAIPQLEAVAAATGPGSYTGIRVAVMAAKSIAYPLNIPLIPLCSMAAYRPSSPCCYAVMIDAKAGGVYLAQVEAGGKLASPVLCSIEAAKGRLKGVERIIAPRIARLEPLFQNYPVPLRWEEAYPHSEILAQHVQVRLLRHLTSVDKLEIRYLCP